MYFEWAADIFPLSHQHAFKETSALKTERHIDTTLNIAGMKSGDVIRILSKLQWRYLSLCPTLGCSARRLGWPPDSCSSGSCCSSLARKGAMSREPDYSVVSSKRHWSSTSTSSPLRTCTCASCC